MKLHVQLILVSLLTLALPWAGCSYLQQMESVLREGQQDAVLSTARSVALALEERPDLIRSKAPFNEGSESIYLAETTNSLVADGYDPEWPPLQPLGDNTAPFRVEYSAAANQNDAWLFIRVFTDSINYHNPALGGIANGDHIKLYADNGSYTNHYWISPDGPGKFVARKRGAKAIEDDGRIRGVWVDTTDGYQLEMSLPRELLGSRFGFKVMKGEQIISTLDDENKPGPLVQQDDTLNSTLRQFKRDNLKLSIVDQRGQIIAEAGQLNYRPEAQEELPPGAWLLEYVYRLVIPDEATGNRYPADNPGELRRIEIRIARDTQEAKTAWYNSGREPASAIISAAVPLGKSWISSGQKAVLVAEQTTDQLLSLTNIAMVKLLGVTLAAVLVIVLGLLGYASLLSFRIRRLNSAINTAMQPDGRVSNSFPAQWGNDEIGDLGRRFGQLLGRVHEYTEYLRTLASKLSHELRTPLALVKSSLDNFEQDPDPKYLQRARQGNERLSSILTAMSEATRVEEAIRSSDQEEIDLVAFVKEYTDHYAGSVEQQFECNSASDAIRIQGSVDLLAQLLDKLFDNAIDFCTSGSVISVDVQQEQGYGCISITNEGPLLPAAMGEQLFDSMVSIRADKGDSTHLGLGLTIVRLVAEFHGGDVAARNLEDASGVEFLVRISV